jgi:hypothetical protein
LIVIQSYEKLVSNSNFVFARLDKIGCY